MTLTSSGSTTPSTSAPLQPQQQQEEQNNEDVVNDTAISASLQTEPEHPDFVTVPVRLHGTPWSSSFLDGIRLLRMGPGVFDGITHSDGQPWWVGHWFDGLSVLHEFVFSSSSSSSASETATTMRCRSRYLAEQVARTVRATPSWRYRELTFGPSSSGSSKRSPPRKLADIMLSLALPATDPTTGKAPEANISVLLQRVGNNGLCARTDGSMCVTLDDDEQNGMNPGKFFTFNDLDDRLNGLFSASHAGVDHISGDMFNFVYGLESMDGNGNVTYTIFRLPCDTNTDSSKNDSPANGQQRAQILTSYKAPAVYMHSVALTPTYVVMMHWPTRLQPMRMLRERCVTRGLSFSADAATEFRLVHRDTGTLMRTVTADAAFAFHVVNAFDEPDDTGGGVVKAVSIDVCTFEDGLAIMDALELEHLRAATSKDDLPNLKLVRYTLPVVADQAEGECRADVRVLHESYIELPSIAPSMTNNARYRYVYGVAHDETVFDSVVKVDVGNGEIVARWGGRSCEDVAAAGDMVVGEPVFVANDGDGQEDMTEDDGVLLIVATQRRAALQNEEEEEDGDGDQGEWRSRLVVVCARTMQTVASATIPYVVPLGFHGTLLRNT